MISPQEAIDAVNGRFGRHPGHRALHAKGLIATGNFTPTPAAAGLCRAAHLQGGPLPATVRFSNAGGDPRVPDYAPDVRGMATSIKLADGSATDIVAQTVPHFPVRNPDEFIKLTLASELGPKGALKLGPFLLRHPHAIKPIVTNLGALKPPVAFDAVPYFAIHAYRWIDADGGSRYVRYTWKPDAPEKSLSPGAAKKLGRDYLQDGLRERLAGDGVRMTLEVQIAAEGDEVDDPSHQWPDDRERVEVGHLHLNGVDDEADAMIFDPTRITDGIELSDDPILQFRPHAYGVSYERRTAKD